MLIYINSWMNVEKKKLIIFYQQVKMLKKKKKTRSFYSYFTIKYIYPTITPSLSLYISFSLSLSHYLSHRSWLSIFLLFSRQPNRIQLLPLSCSISRSRSLIGLGGWFSYYFLGNQTDSRLNFSIILPPIRYLFYFSRIRSIDFPYYFIWSIRSQIPVFFFFFSLEFDSGGFRSF